MKNGKNPRKTLTRTVLPVAALGLALIAAPAPLSAQVSLATVVDLAQRNSVEVRLAEADVQKAQAALDQTLDAYIPNFVIGSQVGYSHGFPTGQPSVGSASMQSLVLSFSQRQYTKAARAGVEAANLSLKDAQGQVALDASTTYIELDTVNLELAAAHQQESFAADLVRIEQQRTEAGVDSNLDLLQTRLKAAEIKLQTRHLETRAGTLAKQLAVLTSMPVGSILPDHSSIPEIPAVTADQTPRTLPGVESATALARSRQLEAHGDNLAWRRPQIGFGAVYNYDSNKLNSYTTYYNNFTPSNISFGLQISFPFFDFSLRAKAKVSAAEALRAKVEAEQAQHQNDVQIATLTGTLRELDAQAEIASLKQQIAAEQLKSVLTQMELGNGSGTGPGAQPQLSPKAEQLARIDERQKFEDSLDAGLDLSKARLNLLRALGHMQDWLNELHTK
ncbi:MAG TPA: TolC family protein [Terracidiphilus sp.]|nr:TolC family protein [Terracidiphilus sp.]